MARNERLRARIEQSVEDDVVEEFAVYVWHYAAHDDTQDAWRRAALMAHGAFMFRTFIGGPAARYATAVLSDIADLCDARADLALTAEIRGRTAAAVRS